VISSSEIPADLAIGPMNLNASPSMVRLVLAVVIALAMTSTAFPRLSPAFPIPEIKQARDLRTNALHFLTFALGLALLFAIRVVFAHAE
jgi:hypothetical protein